MHLHGLMLRVLPAPLAGVACAVIYALLVLAILLLLPVAPADFRYGRY